MCKTAWVASDKSRPRAHGATLRIGRSRPILGRAHRRGLGPKFSTATTAVGNLAWAALTVALLSPAIAIADDAAAGRDAVGVIAEGYLQNRESFTRIDCRFDWVRGTANSIDEARQGKIADFRQHRAGEWFVDGPLVKYQLHCDPSDLEADKKHAEDEAKRMSRERSRTLDRPNAQGQGRISINCFERTFLRNGEYSLKYNEMMLTGNIFGPADWDGEGIRITPFNMDVLGADEYANPGRNLRDAIGGLLAYRFLGAQKIDGVNLLVVEVGNVEGVAKPPQGRHVDIKIRFAFDPQRGYLPIRHIQTNAKGQAQFEVRLLGVTKCSEGRWFPSDVVCVFSPDAKPPLLVDRLTVRSLDVDHAPARDRFQLRMAAGTQVCITVPGPVAFFNLDGARTITPDDLKGVYERAVEHGAAYVAAQRTFPGLPGAAPAADRSERSRRNITWLLVANALAAGAIVLLIFLKRRSRLK